MEEHAKHSPHSETPASCSAAAFQELQSRAQAASALRREQISQLEAELTAQLDAITALASERAEEEEAAADAGKLQEEIERLRQELAESQKQWQEERTALAQERDQLQSELNEARAAVEENQQQAEASQEHAEAAAERDELKQKFELALEDVQRLRNRVTELEQELARRPEPGQADSAELVSLRAERDALADRIEELERKPAEPEDDAESQQMSDLQRRFELAVEDVRELKTKNAQLESQLAAMQGQVSSSSDGGDMDWESQKRRLLASLAGERDDEEEPERKEELTTIESTIQITDAVVADKDQEIAALKAQLAENAEKEPPADQEREKAINELVDADEIVQQHRERIAQIEQEMKEKLRQAELELSVERAKLARQKVELEELRSNLSTQQESQAGEGAALSGTPKRRWLSKLGLGGEEAS